MTSDVTALAVGQSCPSLLLSVKGRIQSELRVFRDSDEAFTLLTTGRQGERLLAGIGRLLVSERADIIGPEPFAMVTLLTPQAPTAGFDLSLAGRVPETWDVVGADADALLTACNATRADHGELDALRIAASIPTIDVDYLPDEALVHELGLERALVSFDKGCYLGQETVARTEYRGKVNRHLRRLSFDRPVDLLSEVTLDGTPVGLVTSVADHPALGAIGLALLRASTDGATFLRVGSDRAELLQLGEGR